MDWNKVKTVYMIGVKGVGMTMLAEFLASQGIKIVGSDTAEVFMTDEVLAKAGIEVQVGFEASRIKQKTYDLIIYSTAYNVDNNEEVAAALSGGYKVMTYAEALAKVFNYRQGIAVCGSHGKTTTTAWLGFVMNKLGMKPSVMVGSKVPQFGGAGLYGKSDYLVIEADEYQNKLAKFEPKIVLLNNIDYDHPDFYPDEASYIKAFQDFIQKIPTKGWLVANFDDDKVKKISQDLACSVISYGFLAGADLVASELAVQAGKQFFRVNYRGDDLGMFKIALIGQHNVLNALAVIATCLELGAELLDLREAMGEFTGTTRRLEYRGLYKNCRLYDDYAHHPTEVKATIQAIQVLYPDKKKVVVFHPHTFTRTKALFADFVQAFKGIDELVLIEIYGSAREEQGGVSSLDLVEKIKEVGEPKKVSFVKDLVAAKKYLQDNLVGGEVVVLMGAGDVFRVADDLLKEANYDKD